MNKITYNFEYICSFVLLTIVFCCIHPIKSHAQAKAGEATVDVGSIVSVGLADTYRRTLAEATNVSYRWYTTDSEISVVTYSKTYAEVKGLKPTSSARVYFTASYYIDGWYRTMDFYYTITVKSSIVYVTRIDLSSYEETMTVGSTKQLYAYVYPTNATNSSVYWESSESSIASVSSNGLVTAKSAAGSVYIYCRAKDGSGEYNRCKVTVKSSEPTSFSAYTTEGVLVNYRNLGNKTCEVYGVESTPAIASNTQGSVTIPGNVNGYKVVSISDYAFHNCSGLTSITIPSNVTTFGSYAFSGCSGITNITIPNSVTTIGNGTFQGCSGLTSITIPNSVTSIGNGAFYYCSSLTSINIPNSVTSIGNRAFHNCSGLSSIIIPSSVTSIGSMAFGGCSGLTSIKVDEKNSKYDSRENSNAIIETSTNTLIAGCKNTIIPNSVASIDSYAFSGCSGLTSITIPNSVTTIGNGAFQGCSGLTSITIPNIVTSIGNGAFRGCSGLTNIAITSSVTSIGTYAFDDCTGLKTIYSYISSPMSTYFDSSNYTDATLYVPKGTKALYQNTDGWKNFQNIVEFDASAVQEISGEETEAKVIGNYSIDGKRLVQPLNGLNLQKLSNGKTIKIINR